MKRFLHAVTDWVSTKKGMRITIIAWLVLMIGLTVAGPKLTDYKVTNFQSLPDEAEAIVAQNKVDELFPSDSGTPGILVFNNKDGEIDISEVNEILKGITDEKIDGIEEIVDLSKMPPQALAAFTSEDKTTMIVPMNLEAGLGNSDYSRINDKASEIGNDIAKNLDADFYITGPAGIAGDTTKLFESADLKLLFATVLIILVLLIVIYRSPLLAFIPLLATVIVYQVTNQSVALLGAGGLEINNATTSIMSILLFAAVIDYSLFVFSRFREELNRYEDKHDAMKHAMRATGEPVFFAGGTVLAAMLVLFLADFRDYQNFAPVFGLAMVIIILASITLVPALFTLFGRKAFWPKVPKYGDEVEVKHGIWGPIAKFVVNKPGLSGGLVAIFMALTALNVFNLDFEFNSVKNFPEDLPSRVGYEIVEEKFNKGDLAQTTVLLESKDAMTEQEVAAFAKKLSEYDEINSASPSGITDNGKAAKVTVSLTMNPYSTDAIDFIEELRTESDELQKDTNLKADISYTGTTAKLADEREVNDGDIIKIVSLETILILILLFVLTRSFKMPWYMMATILLSYASALGLGLFLVDILFGYDAISTRVPVYAFIFLVALGIDYNIILVSRFLEERTKHSVKDALEIAIRNTGGVISSAGVILAATFAALMTMPIADLFVFGFMVAVGIIMDTFLVRGMLLPALIIFFEKDKSVSVNK